MKFESESMHFRIKRLGWLAVLIVMVIFPTPLPAEAPEPGRVANSPGFTSAGSSPLIIDDLTDQYPLGRHLEYLEDPEKKLTIDDVTTASFSSRFIPSEVDVLNFGFRDSDYWLRFDLMYRPAGEDRVLKTWLLELNYPLMHYIELFIFKPDGSFESRKAGGLLPYHQREVDHPNFVFQIPMAPNEQIRIYMRFHSETAKIFPLTLYTQKKFSEKIYPEIYVSGAYFGLMAVMVVYNLFVFLSVRDISYLYYILYFSLLYSAFLSISKYASGMYVMYSAAGVMACTFYFRLKCKRKYPTN